MEPILDDNENDTIGINSEVLYSVSKWGKIMAVLVLLRVLYLLAISAWSLYSLQGTLANEIQYQAYHVLVIIISLLYIPSVSFISISVMELIIFIMGRIYLKGCIREISCRSVPGRRMLLCLVCLPKFILSISLSVLMSIRRLP